MSAKRWLLLLFLLNSLVSYAQPSLVTLSGTVRDAENGETLIGAYVILQDTARQQKVQGGITNQAGFYSVTVPTGTYFVSVRYISYKNIYDTMTLVKNRAQNFDLQTQAISTREVVIQGERGDRNITGADVGKMEMKIEAIKSMPAFMGEADVIKSMQLLPGVQSAGEGNSGYYVRGSGTDQNLVLIDEATVYNAGHLLGFFSIFNTDAIKSVELIKSGMPAYYGGRAASVMNVYQKDGNMKKYHVDGGIGLIFSHLTVQGPFKRDKASFIVSARRTYMDILIQPFLKKTSPLKGMNFYFYDINTKFNIVLNDKNRLYFGAYYGKDAYGFRSSSNKTKTIFDWSNAVASARWNSIISPKLFLNTSFAFSYYDFGTSMMMDVYKFEMRSGIRDYSLKCELSWIPTPKHNTKFGIQNIYHACLSSDYDVEAGTNSNFSLPDPQPYLANELSLYAHDEWEIAHWLKLNMGLRYTNFRHIGAFTRYVLDEYSHVKDSICYRRGRTISQYNRVEPRLSARFLIDSMTSIKTSATVNYQFMHQIPFAAVSLPVDVWMPCTELLKPQTVIQTTLGVFRDFHHHDYETYIDLYYKKMYNLAEYRDGLDFSSFIINPDQLYVYGQGFSCGAEFFIRKTKGRFTGFIGYTLGFTRRKFKDLNNGEPFWAKYDRRHDVVINLSYEIIRNKLSISAVWVYETGNTMTIPVAYYFYMGSYITEYSKRNAYRVKPYHRLDLSLNWLIAKRKRFETGLDFSIYNVYNHKNPFFIYFETTTNFDLDPADIQTSDVAIHTQAYQMSLFPIIPSITWTFKF